MTITKNELTKSAIVSYIKTAIINNKSFPFYGDLEKLFPEDFKDITEQKKNEIEIILIDQLISYIDSWKTKSKIVFKRSFDDNKELFLKFRKLNEHNAKTNPEFHEVWKQVQEIITNDFELFINNQENGKFKDFSFKTQDDFDKYIKTIFPFYKHIWVVVRFVDPATYWKTK